MISTESNGQTSVSTDTVKSVGDWFSNGNFNGHLRSSIMMTVNEGELRDYTTWATGGVLRYATAEYHGIGCGISLNFHNHIVSNDLYDIDPISKKHAKWEIELYDYLQDSIQNPYVKLEELYVSYRSRDLNVRVGNMNINKGPLFFARDGRMDPFVYRGVWVDWRFKSNLNIRLAWISGISTRGISSWYSLEDAIGYNSNGVQPNGSKGVYAGLLETSGIATLGIDTKGKNYNIQLWNFWFDRLMNISWTQMDWTRNHWDIGFQYVFQIGFDKNGNYEYAERYIQPKESIHIANIKLGYSFSDVEISGSFLKTFGDGRFLYPRELGRENFYVSQPRAWIDGYGDLELIMLRFKVSNILSNGAIDVRLSETKVGDSRETDVFNKYNVDDFFQTTLLYSHSLSGVWEGLKLSFLYVNRFLTSEEEVALNEKAYKYDFHHFNLIVNYFFNQKKNNV